MLTSVKCFTRKVVRKTKIRLKIKQFLFLSYLSLIVIVQTA